MSSGILHYSLHALAPDQRVLWDRFVDEHAQGHLLQSWHWGDLKASGQLDSTLVVMMGEFGRTVGKITPAGGRDHYPQQSVIFAGAGVRGGRAVGSTDATISRAES